MEQYKEKVKAQVRNLAVGIAVWALICVLGLVFEAGDVLLPVGGDSHWASMWHGFISGAAFAFLALMALCLVRNLKALKNEKSLKKLYIAETDERNIKIWTSARSASMQIFLMLGLGAGIIAGYFSMTVSITILACVTIHSLIGGACKLYFSKKY